MAWRYFNPNPGGKHVDDCTVRAICAVEGVSWHGAYFLLTNTGAEVFNMGMSNEVFHTTMKKLGYIRHTVPNTCPDCYTIYKFTKDHPFGRYILGTGSHVVGVVNGDYYDTSDSGNEVPLFFYKKEN